MNFFGWQNRMAGFQEEIDKNRKSTYHPNEVCISIPSWSEGALVVKCVTGRWFDEEVRSLPCARSLQSGDSNGFDLWIARTQRRRQNDLDSMLAGLSQADIWPSLDLRLGLPCSIAGGQTIGRVPARRVEAVSIDAWEAMLEFLHIDSSARKS